MAASQKKSSEKGSKKSTTTKKKQTSVKEKDMIQQDKRNLYQREMVLLGSLVISVLLVLSFFNLAGVIGTYLNQFMFGMIGILAYIFPVGLFVSTAFYIVNKGNKTAKRKLISTYCLFVVLSGILQLITFHSDKTFQIAKYYSQSAEEKSGGGVIGGIFANGLSYILGEWGAYVILIALLILLFMLITEKFIFASLGKKSSKRYNEMLERKREKKERNNIYKEEMQGYEEEDDTLIESEREKKAAKVVTFQKETKKEPKEQSSALLFAPDKSLTSKKKEKVIPKVEEKKQLPTLDDIQIERGDRLQETNLKKEAAIYEEELKNKFEKNREDVSGKFRKPMSNLDEVTEEFVITTEDEMSLEQNPMEEATQINQMKESIRKSEELLKSLQQEDIPPVEEEELLYREDKQEALNVAETEEKEDIWDDFRVEDALPIENDLEVFEYQNDSFSEIEPIEERKTEIELDKKLNENSVLETKPEEIEKNETVFTVQNSIKEQPKTEASANFVPEKKVSNEEMKIEMERELVALEKKPYTFPSIESLAKPSGTQKGMSDLELKEKAIKLQSTLESFGVRVSVTNVSCGPSVTRFELQPEQGVKVSKITSLTDDIKLNLAAEDIRIEAPIPGKAAVGIEVPNRVTTMVNLRDLMESEKFKNHSSNIAFAVGKDIAGKIIVTDIAKMPHLLIAGATGSGKSVCINTLIMSILYKANPDDVKMIMIDPKVVELSVYNGIPHLLIPVVTDPKKASAALNWAVMEMTDRYNKFAELGVREIKGYNEKVATVADANDPRFQKMPQIVIIVDELADLMMVAAGEVEEAICRLAQLARAAGIHLIIATQRPSVNVITGLIKANIPSRIAFSVSSAIDSRTILDGAGAEKLLGKGDMLFFPSGYPKPVRVQGAFVSDKEVSNVVEYLSQQREEPQYNEEISNKIATVQISSDTEKGLTNDKDDYFVEAGKFIIEKNKASIGMLQRVYKIGFNRAARIMDQLCDVGVVGPEEGTKPRKVLMSLEEFEQYIEECL